MIILPILTTSLIHSYLKVWENVLFELGSKRVEQMPCKSASREKNRRGLERNGDESDVKPWDWRNEELYCPSCPAGPGFSNPD